MDAMTIEQKRALALAQARLRQQQSFVQLPDGRVERVSAAAGSSPQQVLTEAESLFGKGVTMIPNAGPETMKESMAKASDDMGFGKSILAGLGTRIMETDARLRQLLGVNLSPQETQQIQASREATGPVAAGRFAADLGMGLPLAPSSFLANVAAGGAQSFMTNPVLEGESGPQNALIGAIGSALGYGGAKVMQGIARPITPSQNVRTLAQEGIIPTIGESAGSSGGVGGRTIARLEEAATSAPVLGQVIQGARERAGINELGRAAFARATPRGMPVTERIGREGLSETYDAISSAYTNALNAIGVVRETPRFRQDLAIRVGQATQGLTADQANEARGIIQQIIGNRQSPVGGAYTADIAQQVDSELGARVRDFQNSRDPSGRLMANALRAAQESWRDLIRQNAPNQATRDLLDDARRAFANYVRVEAAVNRPGTVTGEFNATQLAQAVRQTATGARKSAHARGDALMEDLSDPAKAVLRSTLNESGTVPRALLVGGLTSMGLGGGAYANEQMGGPSFLTGLLAASALAPALYSRTASRYAIGDLLPGIQNPVAEMFSAAAPYSGALGRVIADRNADADRRP